MDLTTALKEIVREVVRDEFRAALKEIVPRPSLPERPTSTPLLTTSQAARYSAVHPETVRMWISKGVLPARRTGRNFRIAQDDLDAFLRRCSDGTPDLFDARAAAEALFRKRRPAA